MSVTRLRAEGLDRPVDLLDVVVAEACVLAALGPGGGGVHVERTHEHVSVNLEVVARDVLAAVAEHEDDTDLAPWIDLCAPMLVDQVSDVLGHTWRAEIELGVELLLAERTDAMAAFASASARGPVVVDCSRSEVDILLGDVLAAGRAVMLAVA